MVENKIIIDAEGAVFGRLCSYAAKQALEGNEIVIVNSEKAVVSGNRKDILDKYRNLRAKGGHSRRGPKHSRISYLLMKKGIRGMLPDFRWGEGKQAFSRIKCYDGVPKEFEGGKTIKLKFNKPNKYLELKEISNMI